MSVDAAPTAVASGAIAVVPYDRRWPAAFRHIRQSIGQALEEIAFEAHHIGGTAVPGLCAKPRIDIDVVLHSADTIAEAVDLLAKTDRAYHGDPYGVGMWTFSSHRGFSPGHRLYVCAPETPAHLKRILFRDYLRANPGTADAYAALKRQLVVQSDGNWRVYNEGKSAFVADVVERARSAAADPDRRGRP